MSVIFQEEQLDGEKRASEAEKRTNETVRPISSKILNLLPRLTCPGTRCPIRLHRVHQMTSTVLQRDMIPMVVVHFGNQVHSIRIEGKLRMVDDAEGVQLVTESSFGNDKLSRIRSTEQTTSKGVASLSARCQQEGKKEDSSIRTPSSQCNWFS